MSRQLTCPKLRPDFIIKSKIRARRIFTTFLLWANKPLWNGPVRATPLTSICITGLKIIRTQLPQCMLGIWVKFWTHKWIKRAMGACISIDYAAVWLKFAKQNFLVFHIMVENMPNRYYLMEDSVSPTPAEQVHIGTPMPQPSIDCVGYNDTHWVWLSTSVYYINIKEWNQRGVDWDYH